MASPPHRERLGVAAWCGWPLAGTGLQVPALPVTSHAWHWPPQAVSQQTPSMQFQVTHSAPEEHAVELALRAAQRPPLQYMDVEHAVPLPQHGWPSPPQLQTLLAQTSWAPQGLLALLPQHGWPFPPQVAQLPPEQARVLNEQAPAQHS